MTDRCICCSHLMHAQRNLQARQDIEKGTCFQFFGLRRDSTIAWAKLFAWVHGRCYFRDLRIPILQVYTIFNPHQRCGYSDSPFARIYFFYTAGSGNGFEGMVSVCPHTTKYVDPIKKTLLCYRKIFWGRQTGGKTRHGSAGIDNEIHLSCKRRVTDKFVQK